MTQRSQITVFIPTYHGARYLGDAIQSVLNQSLQEFNIVVWDDGSKDQTLVIARSFKDPRIEVRVGNQNVGMVENWNRCGQSSISEFFTLLHQDDRYHPDYLKNCLAEFRRKPDLGLLATDSRVIDVDGKITVDPKNRFKRKGLKKSEHLGKLLLKGNFIYCPSVMYRTTAFKKIGPFR